MGIKISKMEKEIDTQIETAEELEAEKTHLAEVKEDEIRQEIINEFNFDEDEDKDRITKAVDREIKNRKNLFSAIGQKRKYRDEYNKLKDSPADKKGAQTENLEDLDTRLDAALTKRELEALEYPDEIKNAIKRVIDIDKISIKKAKEDPYVSAKIEAWQKTQKAEDAALGRNNKSRTQHTSDDPTSPPDVDMNTEEGRKEYDDWKTDMIKKGY